MLVREHIVSEIAGQIKRGEDPAVGAVVVVVVASDGAVTVVVVASEQLLQVRAVDEQRVPRRRRKPLRIDDGPFV